jgi:hypothetical protein
MKTTLVAALGCLVICSHAAGADVIGGDEGNAQTRQQRPSHQALYHR